MDKINFLNNKIRFITAVITGCNLMNQNLQISIEEVISNGGILYMGISNKQIIFQMEQLGIPSDLLKRVSLSQCTLGEMEAVKTELQKI